MTLNVISLLTCSQTYEQTSIIMYPMYQRHFMVLHATYHLLKIICIRVDSHGSRNVQTGQTCSNLSTQTVWSCKVSVQSVNRISKRRKRCPANEAGVANTGFHKSPFSQISHLSQTSSIENWPKTYFQCSYQAVFRSCRMSDRSLKSSI